MIEWCFHELGKLLDWVKSWDRTSLTLNIVAAVIVSLALWFFGVFKRIWLLIRSWHSCARYCGDLKEDCETVILIDQKETLHLPEVFVGLDLAKSTFASTEQAQAIPSGVLPDASCVVLGGPGAGKSTLVKHWLLTIAPTHRVFPIFVRLRDYSGDERIEEYVEQKLSRFGVPDAKSFLARKLRESACFCVLDGLDEVRPQQREKICAQINSFYARYFKMDDNEDDHHAFFDKRTLVVSCRKEAYRDIPLDIQNLWEVKPLNDEQIAEFVEKWPLEFPKGKSKQGFLRDLNSAERIHDLARSPLLLVGGLVQYGESRLGIPEQRFEYLQRVTRWLTVDWARAQQFPTDPNRLAYDRILPKLAFHMHNIEAAEISQAKAQELIAQWLPDLGIQSGSDLVLRDIYERTGILVRNAQGLVVFAQFGLQEYYASLEAVTALGIDGLAAKSGNSWWREVILLSAAQQRDPGDLLRALFKQSPLVAVAALAECPTPPLAMQREAVEISLAAIDNAEGSAAAAAIPLLRKTSGAIEASFAEQLEQRLTGPEKVAALVGSILATAGTDASTIVLSRHPEVWSTTLAEASYLSEGFEKLLLHWVESGNEEQALPASRILIERLSPYLLKQMLEMLPKLSPARSEEVSISLVSRVATDHRWNVPCDDLDVYAKCAKFIKDPAAYLDKTFSSDEYQREMTRRIRARRQLYGRMSSRITSVLVGTMMEAQWPSFFSSSAGAGLTALYLRQRSHQGAHLHAMLSQALFFPQCAASLVCTTMVGLMLAAPMFFPSEDINVLVKFVLLGYGLAFGFLELSQPWQEGAEQNTPAFFSVVVAAAIAVAATAFWFFLHVKNPVFVSTGGRLDYFSFAAMISVMAVGAVGVRIQRGRPNGRRTLLGGVPEPLRLATRMIASGGVALGVVIGVDVYLWRVAVLHVAVARGAIGVLGICLASIAWLSLILLHLSWYRVRRANGAARQALEGKLNSEIEELEKTGKVQQK